MIKPFEYDKIPTADALELSSNFVKAAINIWEKIPFSICDQSLLLHFFLLIMIEIWL